MLGFAIVQANLQILITGQEWQAQYFASCLLMPRHVLEDKRRGRDLTNWKHLYAMVDEAVSIVS